MQNKNVINSINICPITLGESRQGFVALKARLFFFFFGVLSVFTFLSDCPETLIVQHTSVYVFSVSILLTTKLRHGHISKISAKVHWQKKAPLAIV